MRTSGWDSLAREQEPWDAVFISQNVSLISLRNSTLHKIVHLLSTITIINNKLTILWGTWLSKTNQSIHYVRYYRSASPWGPLRVVQKQSGHHVNQNQRENWNAGGRARLMVLSWCSPTWISRRSKSTWKMKCGWAGGPHERDCFLDLWRRTVNLRRPEKARNEGSTGPKRLDDTRCTTYQRRIDCRMEKLTSWCWVGVPAKPRSSSSFLLLSSSEMSDTTIFEPRYTSPPRNRSTFLLTSCSWIENCTSWCW